MNDAQNDTPNTIESDGYIIDAVTGEILGMTGDTAFRVDDLGSAEWVLEKMQIADAAAAGLKSRKRALVENIDKLIREQENKRNWLQSRYGEQLAAFAAQNMPRGKKTWACPFGAVAFRAVPARVVVEHPDLAADAIRAECPDAVITEVKVQVSKFSAALKTAILSGARHIKGVIVEPERESVSIKTGVTTGVGIGGQNE